MTYAHTPAPVPPLPPTRKQVNHLLHLVLTILTAGAWLVMVWPWYALLVNGNNAASERRYQRAYADYHRQLQQWQMEQKVHGGPFDY